jgi:hypothetical protein
MKKTIAICLTAALLLSACGPTVFAGSPEEAMPERQNGTDDIPVIIDVLLLRPLGLVGCVVGLAAAVIALPFAIPSGSMDKVSQALIREPFYYTFKRPLGKNMPRP